MERTALMMSKMARMKNSKIYIGVDPSFRKAGFAVAIIDEDNTVAFRVFKNGFAEFIEWCFDAPNVENSFICVENSNLQNKTFDMRGNKHVLAKKSRDVGKNQAASQYTFDLCRKIWKGHAFEVSPKEKGGKWDDQRFRQVAHSEGHTLLNYKGNKNEQDKRDAYQIALISKRLSKRVKK